MPQFYGPRDPETEALIETIKKQFNIPDHFTHFSLHFGIDQLVTIDCTYYPARREDGDTTTSGSE